MKKIEPLERFLLEDSLGFKVRRNPKNGFVVVELDYFADPIKRNPQWVEEEKRGMPPKQWSVEMDRSWETFAGRPVYEGSFSRSFHIAPAPLTATEGFPLYRGWDFGGNQSMLITQFVRGQLRVLAELPNHGPNTRQFAPEVIAFSNTEFGMNYPYLDIVDPSAMWEGKTAEGKACTDVMREEGLHPTPAPTNDPEKRTDAVRYFLHRQMRGQPCLLISPTCVMLIKGFEGGYHFPEKGGQSRKADKPVKNLYSHIHDCLQYIALRLRSYEKRNVDEETEYERSIAHYGFMD